jgi:hypothetical protein
MKTLPTLVILCIVAYATVTHAQYALTLRCEGMETYLDKAFHIRVIEAVSGQEVGRKTISHIQNDTFDIGLYVLLQGIDYEVDFYVDQDGDGSYDPPPFDHAWRRMVINPSGDIEIVFTPGFDYTNIAFPEWIKYRSYLATWGGRWTNQTLGSSDSIDATLKIICDSLSLSFTTAGIFGNPDTVSFVLKTTRPTDFDPASDTLHFIPDQPWTGEIHSINGELHGNISLLEMGLAFNGTMGLHQVLSDYEVIENGNPIANGYFYLQEVDAVEMYAPLEVAFIEVPISCHGGSDGSIYAEVTGGTGYYYYNWWPIGTTTPSIQGAWADTFYVEIDDDFDCPVVASYILNDPEPIIVDVYVTNASCPGVCDALIEVLADGEHPPFSYSIEGDSCTGFNTIFVTDAIGCVDSTEVFIGTDSDLTIFNIDITSSTNGQSDGSVEVFVAGGFEPYLYSLDEIVFQLSPVFTNLPPGSYCISIQDANGCLIKTDTFVIENVTAIREIHPGLSVYPNPASSKLYVSCDELISMDLMDLNGTILKHSPLSGKHEVGVEELPRGMYLLRLSGAGGYQFQKMILD